MQFKVDGFIKHFNNEECENLRGIPKFIIINGCRGDTVDGGVITPLKEENSTTCEDQDETQISTTEQCNVVEEESIAIGDKSNEDNVDGWPFMSRPSRELLPSEGTIKRPTWEDMIILNATVEGYYSWR